MRSAWKRWLPVVAMIGVAGCSSGKGWSMASLWPWGKSNASAAQNKALATTTPQKPPLATAGVKPQTLNGQTQLAANTGAPAWNGVTTAGGAGAMPGAAAPGGYPSAGDALGAPGFAGQNYGPSSYGAAGAGGAQNFAGAASVGGAPSYATPPNSGYGGAPSYGTQGLGASTPGYPTAGGSMTGVTPGFEAGATPAWSQAQVNNPFAQQGAAAPSYNAGQNPSTGGSFANAGFGGFNPGGNASPFPGNSSGMAQPGASGATGAEVWGGQNPMAGASTPGYPSAGDASAASQGPSYNPGSAASQGYFGTASAPTSGGFAPGSTRPMTDASVPGAGGYPQTATNLAAPPMTNSRF